MNFPEVAAAARRSSPDAHPHENRPGVLTALNQILPEQGVNIAAPVPKTSARNGVVIDIEADGDVAGESAAGDRRRFQNTARLLYYILNGQETPAHPFSGFPASTSLLCNAYILFRSLAGIGN